MDSWSLDRYESGEYFAGMMDAGYSKYIGKQVDGKVLWRINEYYSNPLEYIGITQEEFEAINVSYGND